MARTEGSITRADVLRALEIVYARNEKPSAEKIRDQIGRGSKSTIIKYWKELERDQQLAGQQAGSAKALGLSEATLRAFQGDLYAAREAARAESAELIETLQGQLDESLAELEHREKELTAAQDTIARLKEEQSVLMGKMAQVQEDAKLARDSLQSVVVDLAVARTHLQAKAHLEEEITHIRLELAKAQDALSKRQAKR